MSFGRRWIRVAVALIAITTAASCGGEETPPNVILIVVDTLRADHLGCYGYVRDTSPRLDLFARDSTLYTRAMASSPWTVPSHASMFTGLNPFEHGAHTCMRDSVEECVFPLAERHTTLAEVLRDRGYQTTAFVANSGYLRPLYRLDQGFDQWKIARVSGSLVTSTAMNWLREERGGPFFMFLNYMDTHRIYNTSPRPGLLERPAVQDRGELLNQLIAKVLPGRGGVPPQLVRQVVDQYDTAVANTDEALGTLFDGLKELDLLTNTIVVVTSDHGEYLGEHHLVEHSKDVYQQAQWIPLVVRAPGQTRGERLDTMASSADLPHLILKEFPASVRRELLPLFPNAPGNHLVISENYYTRAKDLYDKRWGHRFNRVRTAAYDWPHKYIRSSDGHHELYDLAGDPLEAINLYSEGDPIATRLSATLARFQTERLAEIEGSSESPAEMNQELREQLRSLGYVD